MALKPKDIIDTVTGAGRNAVSGVAGIARRFRREEDDAVIPSPEASAPAPAAPPAKPRSARAGGTKSGRSASGGNASSDAA